MSRKRVLFVALLIGSSAVDSEALWRRIDPEIYEYFQMDKCGHLISK